MVCCSPTQDIRRSVTLALGESAPRIWGPRGKGDRKRACHLGAVCSSSPTRDRKAQCDPASGPPRARHSVAFVPQAKEPSGSVPCNWCQGKRSVGWGANPAGWHGGGHSRGPSGAVGWVGRPWPARLPPPSCPGKPLSPGHTPAASTSCWCQRQGCRRGREEEPGLEERKTLLEATAYLEKASREPARKGQVLRGRFGQHPPTARRDRPV